MGEQGREGGAEGPEISPSLVPLGGGLLCMQRHCYLGSGANLPWCGTLCVDASAVPRHLKESLTSRKRLGEAKGTLSVDASAVPRHLKESLTSRKRLGEAKARSML